MSLVNKIPSGHSSITKEFVEDWKAFFDETADQYLRNNSYSPIPIMQIAEDFGCEIVPIPVERLDEKDGNGDKIIGFFSMGRNPKIFVKAEYEEEDDWTPDYNKSVKKLNRDNSSNNSDDKKRLVYSRKPEEGRTNRIVLAYYSAVAAILLANPQLENSAYHIMYDKYESAESYLGGLPWHFVMQLLLNDKTISRCSSASLLEQEHYLSVDAKLIETKRKSMDKDNIQVVNDDEYLTLKSGQLTFLSGEYTAKKKK